MSIQISVITWRLGASSTEEIEEVIPYTDVHHILEELSIKFGGIFYLQTCQRLILVAPSSEPEDLATAYSDIIMKKTNPEKFSGREAIDHLLYVISSLDSIVVGEDQILHQFRNALKVSLPYMNGYLTKIIEGVIRTGKQLRRSTFLKYSRRSTIALIFDLFTDEIRRSKKVGILGTGKMAQLIVESFQKSTLYSHVEMRIYTNQDERTRKDIAGIYPELVDEMGDHDLLFLATSGKLDKELLQSVSRDLTVFDFGLPRHTDESLSEKQGVNIYTMNDLFKLSRNSSLNEGNKMIKNILDEERDSIIRELKRYETKRIWNSLRSRVSGLADQQKNDFIRADPIAEENFRRFVNHLLHITQKELEEAVLEEKI